jgi:hypothetical protein
MSSTHNEHPHKKRKKHHKHNEAESFSSDSDTTQNKPALKLVFKLNKDSDNQKKWTLSETPSSEASPKDANKGIVSPTTSTGLKIKISTKQIPTLSTNNNNNNNNNTEKITTDKSNHGNTTPASPTVKPLTIKLPTKHKIENSNHTSKSDLDSEEQYRSSSTKKHKKIESEDAFDILDDEPSTTPTTKKDAISGSTKRGNRLLKYIIRAVLVFMSLLCFCGHTSRSRECWRCYER